MKVLILKGHTRPLTQIKYNADGDLLFSCAKDDVPTVWTTVNGARLGTFDGHSGTVWSLDVNGDSSRLLTAGGDQSVKLWNVATGALLASFQLTGPARHVEWAEGDNAFIAISDPFVSAQASVWVFSRVGDVAADASAGVSNWAWYEWKTTGVGQNKRIARITWGPVNETVITGDDAGVIRVHDPKTGEILREVREHSKRISSFQWNAEKTLLISGSADQTAKLFDVATWRVLRVFETEVPVNSAAISPIKEHCFVAGGQEAMNVTTTSMRAGKFETKIFHSVFGDNVGVVRGHFGPVNCVALAPDGSTFASGSEDGYIRLHFFDQTYFSMHREYDDLEELQRIAASTSTSASA